MTLALFIRIVFGVFSFKPGNMRFFNGRRILVCITVMPLFIFILMVNRLFLLLDYLFYPRFTRQRVEGPIFIISAPRTATSFLFHTLAETEKFTCMKLWEIVFAPSIIQKKGIISLLKIDRRFGSSVKTKILAWDKKVLQSLKGIHPMGLDLPEEDEAILLWSLSSLYMLFFFPDSKFYDDEVLFDDRLSLKRRRRIMNYYKKYIQRHNYVFNPHGKRQYLSKNPFMMCKIASLSLVFPDAKIITISRSISEQIPSAVALNRRLYGLFTSIPMSAELQEKITQTMLKWHIMASRNLNEYHAHRYLKLDFQKLINQDKESLKQLSYFLEIDIVSAFLENAEQRKTHRSSNIYEPLDEEEVGELLDKKVLQEEHSELWN